VGGGGGGVKEAALERNRAFHVVKGQLPC